MDRVRISRRDTADTGITAEPPDSSLHVQSFSLSGGSSSLVDEGEGTEVGSCLGEGTEVGSCLGEGTEVGSS